MTDHERVLFSCRGELLVTKFGRSSKPSPRVLVLVSSIPAYKRPEVWTDLHQTTKAVYIVLYAMVNGQLSISSERTIPLGAIKYVSTSTLKDDWFSLGVSSPQEADPLLNCVFKTEFFLHLKMSMPGGLNLQIADS